MSTAVGKSIRERLSKREWDVVCTRCREGKSNREVGETLFLTEQTVKNLVTMILKKLPEYRTVEHICTHIGPDGDG